MVKYWPEFSFLLFCLFLCTLSYSVGSCHSLEIPNTLPSVEKDGAKFWEDKEVVATADRLGLKGTAAFIVLQRLGARYSVIAFPNGFVQMRGSREENFETLREIKRGVDAKKR